MRAMVFLFAVVACLVSHAALVSSTDYYKTSSKPIADRLFELAMAANCRGVVGKFPPSALSNKGPLVRPKHNLTTDVKPFGVMVTVDRSHKVWPNVAEYGPVGGFVVADASDGSISVSFANGWDDVYLRYLVDRTKKYKYCDAKLCDKRCVNCATGKCHHCSINHGFLAAYTAVKFDVYQIIDAYTREGFDGPIFLTGYSLGGALAMEGGLQMGILTKYQQRCAAVYTFGTPKVFKDCDGALGASSMGFFRVHWPNDSFPFYNDDDKKPGSLEGSVTSLWYSDPETLGLCFTCKRMQFTMPVVNAINATIEASVIKPIGGAFNLLCKGAHIPYKLLTGSRRHCPEQSNVLTYAPSCRGHLTGPDLEDGYYQPLMDAPAESSSKH